MSETILKSKKDDISPKEIKEVILNIQEAALNIDDVIHLKVKPKYPTKHIARPSQAEARQGHKGWKYLKYNSIDQTLEEVASIDQADTTQSNVLCWRDKRIQDYIDMEDGKKRKESNARAQYESTRTHEGLNSALVGMGAEKIKAKPLTLEDE